MGAQVCYVVGVYGECSIVSLATDTEDRKAMNMVIAFYAATFPGLVQDLPEVIKSEQDVMDGTVSPEAHDNLVSYQRSKVSY